MWSVGFLLSRVPGSKSSQLARTKGCMVWGLQGYRLSDVEGVYGALG